MLVVTAFALLQLKRLSPYRLPYLALNFAGTAVLTGVAVSEGQPGFVLTNGVWAAVSLIALSRLARQQGRS